MTTTIEQQILAASAIAFLLVDSDLLVRGVGGRNDIIDALGAGLGQPIVEILPELYGSEEALAAIISGALDRLHLPEINRDGAGGALRYFDLLVLPHVESGGLIHVIADVSARSTIMQSHVQQRNDYRLLKERVTQQNIELARVNAELRRATQMKDEFLASISHEVRTPLTAILGLAEMTRIRLKSLDPAVQIENLRGIEESGRHLLALINDFLDIARIEAGRFELDKTLISVQELCEGSERMIAELAMRKNITLSMQIDPQVQMIRADHRRLRQALINLYSNAIKFTSPGGKTGLEVIGDPEAELIRITVWDTGIGIAQKDMARLFKPFIQIEGDHQLGHRGSGLGLALVAQLVQLHGGGVSLSSDVGQGSRFTLALPWSPSEQLALFAADWGAVDSQQGDRAITDPAPSGNGEMLLLVEDHPASAALLAEYLRRCGYTVTHAGSGDEALAHMREQIPSLIVSDIRMHGIDGLELIRRIRAGLATQSIPIIALTALAMPGDRERCLEAGASRYISKPLPLNRLAEAVADLLREPEG
jgi:signal transduction histidine kinase/CheY-like chemotaxis protein